MEDDDVVMNDEQALLENRYYIMGKVSVKGSMLRQLPKHYRSDKEIALIALTTCGSVFQCLSKELRDDEEVLMAAVKRAPGQIKSASKRLRRDIPFICRLLLRYPIVYNFLCDDLKRNKEFALLVVPLLSSSWQLKKIMDSFPTDKDVNLAVITKKPDVYLYINDSSIRSDVDICLASVHEFQHEYNFPAEIYENKDFIMAALDKDNNLWHKLRGSGKNLRSKYPTCENFRMEYNSSFIKS